MLFSSNIFVVLFLPLAVAGYYAVAQREKAGRTHGRLWFLILASLIFYGYWDWRFLPLLVGLTTVNWLVAQAFLAGRVKRLLTWAIAGDLAVLGVFKYLDFLIGNLNEVPGVEVAPPSLILPLGISFFTFQMISYMADLKRGNRHGYSYRDFLLYICFFPQLIAGPIVRHDEIMHQFERSPLRDEMWENLSRGAVLFLIGLGKKTLIADSIAPNVDRLYALAAGGTALTLGEAWAAVGGYALQIYFDFSGYSDMALGIALMLGLSLPFNFHAPYRAHSIRDFWRRWHITLSRFLRDYVYVPLGGNRRGLARQAMNVTLTMLLGGLWHGAGWTFVVWGGLHGLALAINNAWAKAGLRMPQIIGWALTLSFVVLAWIPFRAPDFATAWSMLSYSFGAGGLGLTDLDNGDAYWFGIALALLGPVSHEIALGKLRPWRGLAIGAGLSAAFFVFLMGGRLQNDFIYFQF